MGSPGTLVLLSSVGSELFASPLLTDLDCIVWSVGQHSEEQFSCFTVTVSFPLMSRSEITQVHTGPPSKMKVIMTGRGQAVNITAFQSKSRGFKCFHRWLNSRNGTPLSPSTPFLEITYHVVSLIRGVKR